MARLKTYEERQAEAATPQGREPSGVMCTENYCRGEMMIVVPHEEHYVKGKPGESNAIKSGLLRAICGNCGWKGWV